MTTDVATTDVAVLAPRARSASADRTGGLSWVVADALTVTKRNLIALFRDPEILFFNSALPVIFVFLFRYVFGGAIHISGHVTPYLQHHYVSYMMPGIFVETVGFAAVTTAIGLAEDLQKGLIERFRALPMARSAVLAGRTIADLLRNVFLLILMVAVGYAVGFRVQTNVGAFLAAAALVLLFAFLLSWGFAIIGLTASNGEAAEVMSFPILFLLIFVSSAFVPVQAMPGWLQAFAKAQPFGPVVNATRALMFGGPTATSVEQSLAWCAGLLLLIPLAVWRYRRAT